jgi:hypothetical protein
MRKPALITCLSGLLLVSALASPGSAVTGPFHIIGTANMASGSPCTGACNGTLSGVIRGVFASPTVICVPGCPVMASFTYNDPGGVCVQGVPFAPLGTANGTMTIQGTVVITLAFSWTRVGSTAWVIFSGDSTTGSGTFHFVPASSCGSSGGTFVGEGSFA